MKRYLDNIHEKLFRRMHDLDYLQWMQRNSGRYIAGAAILALLVMTALYPKETTWQSGNWQMTDNQPAFQNIAQEAEEIEQSQLAEQYKTDGNISDSIMKERDTESIGNIQPEPQQKEAMPDYIDPLQLRGYIAPVNGPLQYGYGLGYDAIHEDYRFHTDVCYGMGDGDVRACASGIITQVVLTEQWEIMIRCEGNTIQYTGLDYCSVQNGNTVTAGEKIGEAKGNIFVQVTATNY